MARHQFRVVALMAIAVSGLTASAAAQQTRRGNPTAPRVLVPTLRASDKKLGPDAGDAVRSEIEDAVSVNILTVIPKTDFVTALSQSGYPVDEALSTSDAAALAKLVRADEYIDGTVTKTATGFTIEASVVLTADPSLVQPLGTFDGVKLDQVAAKVAKEFANAYKAFEANKTCRNQARGGAPALAQKAITDGLVQYPKSTWLRMCELGLYVEQKRPAADIVKVAEEITALDPNNKVALKELIKQYDITKESDKKIALLRKLHDADPTDTKLTEQIVNEYAIAKKFDLALPLIEKAVADNPGDIALIRDFYLVLGAVNNTKKMAQVGEEMVKIDTSLADADFYDRQMVAYTADSNFQKAAETAARATGKFPKNADFWLRRGNFERKIGQTQQSVASLKRALEIDPKIAGARGLILTAYVEMQQYDSAFVAMHEAIKAGEDANVMVQTSLTIGNRLFTAANKQDHPKTVEEFQKGMPYLNFADSVLTDRAQKNNAKFLIGVSQYFIATLTYTEATKNKSCGVEGAQGLLAGDQSSGGRGTDQSADRWRHERANRSSS